VGKFAATIERPKAKSVSASPTDQGSAPGPRYRASQLDFGGASNSLAPALFISFK